MRGEPKAGIPVKVKELENSPRMVINKIKGTKDKDQVVETTWFENGVQQTGDFNPDVLEKAVDEPAPAAKKEKGKK